MAEWVSLAISWLAVIIAVWQLRIGVQQQRRQAAFERVQDIRSILQQARAIDPLKLGPEIVDFYKNRSPDLSEPARQYMQLLDAFDVLGLAYKKNAVDRSIVREYLQSLLLSPNTISRQIINGIRSGTGVENDYEHLEYLLHTFELQSFGERIRQWKWSDWRKVTSRISSSRSAAASATTPEEQLVTAGEGAQSVKVINDTRVCN